MDLKSLSSSVTCKVTIMPWLLMRFVMALMFSEFAGERPAGQRMAEGWAAVSGIW